MLNKVKVSTIPLQNGECAVEIVITIGTDQPKKAYMYAGLLYCGDCGMSMVRRSYLYRGKPVVNYICSNYNRNLL